MYYAIIYSRKKVRSSYTKESSAPIKAPEAQVSEGLSSSVFEITTLANIPADQSGHKVNIYDISCNYMW